MRIRCGTALLALLAAAPGPAPAEPPAAEAPKAAAASAAETPAPKTPTAVAPAPAAEPATIIRSWFERVPLDARVTTELAAFEKIDETQAAGLAEALRARVRSELEDTLRDLAANGPRDFVEVSYGLGDPKPEDDGLRDFVNSIVRTEAAAFYPDATMSPEDVLSLWGSEEFRKRSSGRIVSVRMVDGLYCVETKGVGPFLGPMSSCARLEELLQPTLCCQHSQVVTNDRDEDRQRVFFKESVKTVIRRQDGLWVHYLNYSRTKGLSGLSKRIGRGKVKGAQEKLFRELAGEVGPPGAGGTTD